jgi:putative FmdB family regulatory protein
MPIYEYTCQDCGTHFEKLVRSITVTVKAECPECGGMHTRKGWSVFGTGKSEGSMSGLSTPAVDSCSPAGT